jgi:uncharacterized iron-regulated protein
MIPVLIASLFIPILQPPTLPPNHPQLTWSYVPQRVFDTRQKAFSDFETMLADLARADVIFLGEQHDDPNTHRLELAVLEGLTRRHVALVFAAEMFERDVQPVLDQYLAGKITEEQFLGGSRPWPRYATDYRPLIEFAKSHEIPVIASNVPRRIASDVSKTGLSVLNGLGVDRALAARDVHCPTSGAYYDRFIEAMSGGGHPPTASDAASADARVKNDRFYFAQCLKDETMAESIADGWQKNYPRRAAVVHLNGSFHTDYAQGTAAATANRMGGRRIAVVSLLPVDDIDRETPDADDVKLGDYLVYTVKPITAADPASPPRRTPSRQ